MVILLNLFLASFYLCLSYDIIPITNFEKKMVSLTESKNFAIFSYIHQGTENEKKYIHRIRKYYFESSWMKHMLYIYDNISQITQTESGSFINYIFIEFLEGPDDCVEFEDKHNLTKTYYFVIKNNKKEKYYPNITFTICSTETLTILSNMVQTYYSNSYSYNTLLYTFKIPPEHKKYFLIIYRALTFDIKGDLFMYENGENLVYNNSLYQNESYIELKNDCFYIIHLNLKLSKHYNNEFYFYLAQSAYNKFLPVDIDTEYFENYPIFGDVYLLLNISTVKKGYKVMMEYNYNFKDEDTNFYYYVYRYDTEDENVVENTEGEKIEFLEDESKCNRPICSEFIHKNSNDMKLVVFKIKYPYNSFSLPYYFDFRYRQEEKYVPSTIYISCAIGIALSVPNIIAQIIISCKGIKSPTFLTFVMDLILHLIYSNFLSIFIYLGRDASFWLGIGLTAIYLLFALYNFNYMCEDEKTIFTGFKCLLAKCKNLRIYKEAINERRRLPPEIRIGGYVPKNKDNIDEKDEKELKETDYEYGSWEDSTDFTLSERCPVLNCYFELEVNLDKKTKEDLDSMKGDYENFYINNFCPNFQNSEKCYLESYNTSLNIFLIFLWFIFFITGYLDIFEIFIYFEEVEKIHIKIKKTVSNTKALRAGYKQIDEKIPDDSNYNREEKYKSFNAIELKDEYDEQLL